MQLNHNHFKTKEPFSFNKKTKVVFVADLFVEHYVGGAELTTDALIQKCKFGYEKILSKDLNIEILESGKNLFWVFGNFSGIDMNLIPTIVANIKYVVLEYDYKYCRYRSPEKHKYSENVECDCENTIHGKMISAFYLGSMWMFWMSEAQMNHYFKKFPFLQDSLTTTGSGPGNTVLSSVFDDRFFINLKYLNSQPKNKKGTIVLGSTSWVKGLDQAEKWCKDNNEEYEIVWDVPYEDLLVKLSNCQRVVYLPRGMDTCPRFVIESKLLGCELVINDNVQHGNESWFNTDNLLEIEEYLYASRDLFWNTVKSFFAYEPTISGYVTTKDCISQGYPIKDCIYSMGDFCDEIIVVDGGSTDGTLELLTEIQNDLSCLTGTMNDREWLNKNSKLKVQIIPRDWNDSRFAVFDGAQKAEARKLCTKEFCWQMDADEKVSNGDGEKIKDMCRNWPEELVNLISLPVVEYWGSKDKARIDVNPWKWRLSKNHSFITHGIPSELRKFDEEGKLYSLPGSDGCDMIHAETFERIPHASFYGEDAHNVRFAALNGNVDALRSYEMWMKEVVKMLPVVEHYSWMDIERKIKTYQQYWSKHWQSLHNIEQIDTPENNMFFDKCWKDVTDEDIKILAKDLSEKTGGHIFHRKIDLNYPTPFIKI